MQASNALGDGVQNGQASRRPLVDVDECFVWSASELGTSQPMARLLATLLEYPPRSYWFRTSTCCAASIEGPSLHTGAPKPRIRRQPGGQRASWLRQQARARTRESPPNPRPRFPSCTIPALPARSPCLPGGSGWLPLVVGGLACELVVAWRLKVCPDGLMQVAWAPRRSGRRGNVGDGPCQDYSPRGGERMRVAIYRVHIFYWLPAGHY